MMSSCGSPRGAAHNVGIYLIFGSPLPQSYPGSDYRENWSARVLISHRQLKFFSKSSLEESKLLGMIIKSKFVEDSS